MKLLSVLTLLLSSLLQVHQSNSQLCNNRVTPIQFLASPSTFEGVITLTPSKCSSNTVEFRCLYSVILGDNEPVPLQPNLENSGGGDNDIGKFLVWPSSTERPYMSIELGGRRSVTAINIEFLNYPAQGFSLPNLELYSTTVLFTTDPASPMAQCVEFELRNNIALSQDDYQVTSISLVFSRTSSIAFLLHWNYTGVYNLNFFMVSEVDFCNDPQPPDETQITFQIPQSDNSVIIPTVEEFIGTTKTTLNCTVSSSGLFEWRWRQNGSMISNTGRFSIFTADSTRTTILQMTGLSVNDAADTYTCEVRRRGGGGYMPRTQTLSFRVIVDLPGQVTGYLDDGQVMLTCDVYGFLRSIEPPIWLGTDSRPVDLKYTIEISHSSQTAVLVSNGSIVPGWRSTLIINHLGMAGGTYTCMVDGNSATVQLTVVAGSAPTTRSVNEVATLSNDTRPSVSNTTKLTVAIAVVLVLIIVVIIIALLVIVCLTTRKRRRISSKVHQLQNVSAVLDPKTRDDENGEEPYMDSQYDDINKPPQNGVKTGTNSATIMDALYSNPDEVITDDTYSHLRDSQKINVTPQKNATAGYEYSQLNYSQIDPIGQKSGPSPAQQEPTDVGMLYAIPDKKIKASNKAPGVPEKSFELVEYLDFREEGIVSSGIDLSECSQTDPVIHRSRPSLGQQEPIDVDMLYAIPDKKKKVSK